MQSRGHETQAKKTRGHPLDHVTEGTLSFLFYSGSRNHFVALCLTNLAATLNPLSLALQLLALHAGSDSGEISSTCPRPSRSTRWQRLANDILCVAMREVSWCSR